MVKTPPYQKRGKCGHFMPQFDTHGSCFVEPSARDWIPVHKELTPHSVQRVLH